METDISVKVEKIIKLFLPGILLVSLFAGALIVFYQSHHRHLALYNAQVNGRMVRAVSRTEGNVTELLVSEGEMVKTGQPIARLKVNVTEEQLKQLQQNVTLAEQNLAKLREGNVITRPVYNGGTGSVNAAAEERLARMEELYKLGAISAAERDAAAAAAQGSGGGGSVTYETIVQPASPEVLQRGEIRLKQAQEALKNAQQNFAATEISAPVAGTVYLQELQEGTEVAPGQVLALIGSNKELWVEAEVARDRAEQIFSGQFAQYTIKGHKFTGTVSDIKLNDETATVYISLPVEHAETIKPGQKAEVKLSL